MEGPPFFFFVASIRTWSPGFRATAAENTGSKWMTFISTESDSSSVKSHSEG
jgi:hypothetical protein